MTLQQRQQLIDSVVREVSLEWYALNWQTQLAIVRDRLLRVHGLTVTPDEVTRVLAEAAGFVH